MSRLRCKETEHWSDPPSTSMIVGRRVFPSNLSVRNYATAGTLTHLSSQNREAKKKDPPVAKHLPFQATLKLLRGLLTRPGIFKFREVPSSSLPHMIRKGGRFDDLDTIERIFCSTNISLVVWKKEGNLHVGGLWVAVLMWFRWIPIQMFPVIMGILATLPKATPPPKK